MNTVRTWFVQERIVSLLRRWRVEDGGVRRNDVRSIWLTAAELLPAAGTLGPANRHAALPTGIWLKRKENLHLHLHTSEAVSGIKQVLGQTAVWMQHLWCQVHLSSHQLCRLSVPENPSLVKKLWLSSCSVFILSLWSGLEKYVWTRFGLQTVSRSVRIKKQKRVVDVKQRFPHRRVWESLQLLWSLGRRFGVNVVICAPADVK